MTQAIRYAATFAALFLLEACVRVGHIQQTEPVRTTKFTGSHKAVAQCIQQRLGGKVQDEGFGEKYIIYDSVKGMEAQGLTHYAITVARTGPDRGVVEWRIASPRGTGGPEMPGDRASDPGGLRTPTGTLAASAVGRIWGPAGECAASAKSRS